MPFSIRVAYRIGPMFLSVDIGWTNRGTSELELAGVIHIPRMHVSVAAAAQLTEEQRVPLWRDTVRVFH